MPREQPALVFQRVAEWHVRDIVKQGGHADRVFKFNGHGQARAPQARDDPMRHRANADRVIEARMQRARIDEMRGAKLFDSAQSLHDRQIDNRTLETTQLDIAMDRITQQHRLPVSG